jgi:hypothetical protein
MNISIMDDGSRHGSLWRTDNADFGGMMWGMS